MKNEKLESNFQAAQVTRCYNKLSWHRDARAHFSSPKYLGVGGSRQTWRKYLNNKKEKNSQIKEWYLSHSGLKTESR